MNLIFHLFKTDVRHFRWRIGILWLLFATHALLFIAVGSTHKLSTFEPVLLLFQLLFGAFLIAGVIHADAFVGTNASWLARPARRSHVFFAKSIFLIAIILIPKLLAELLLWSTRGYSGVVVLLELADVALWTAGCILVITVPASLTRALWRFMLCVAAAVLLLIVFTMAVVEMRRSGFFGGPSAVWWAVDSAHESRKAVAVLAVLAVALTAWFVHGLFRRTSLAVACYAAALLAFPTLMTTWKWNFLQPRLNYMAPPSIVVIETEVRPGAHRITDHLAVEGLNAAQVAVAQSMAALRQNSRELLRFGNRLPFETRWLPSSSGSAPRYFELIRGHFPSNTVWAGHSMNVPAWTFRGSEMSAYTSGSVELDVFTVRKAAELPLKAGVLAIDSRLQLRMKSVSITEDEIAIRLDEYMARPSFDRHHMQAFASGRSPAPHWNTQYTCVVYHPGDGEAFIATQTPGAVRLGRENIVQLSIRIPYSELRRRATGVSAAEWAANARLVVFRPVYEGTAHAEWSGTGIRQRQPAIPEKRNINALAAIESANLGSNASPAEIGVYLDGLLKNLPAFWGHEAIALLRSKLRVLGPEAVPLILERMPVRQVIEETCVIPFLKQRMRREHLPDLQRCIARDLGFVRAIPDASWKSDLRPTIIQLLGERRLPATPEAFRIVADACDPSIYPLLHWHFVHLQGSRASLIPALERCPGFDLNEAIREAWELAQVGAINDPDLTVAAARLRLPNAFVEAVTVLEAAPEGGLNEEHVRQVAAIAGYEGPMTNAVRWLSANLERLANESADAR